MDRQKITDIAGFIERMNENNWKIIHLQRENVLKQEFSGLMAEKTGKYHISQKEQSSKIPKINVPILDLEERLSRRISFSSAEIDALGDIPRL
jgi:hypothetical protein